MSTSLSRKAFTTNKVIKEYMHNAYWLEESSTKIETFILNMSREIHVLPNNFQMDITNNREALLLERSYG